jgi:hypothetical protein
VRDVVGLEHGVFEGGEKGAELAACVEKRQKLPPARGLPARKMRNSSIS